MHLTEGFAFLTWRTVELRAEGPQMKYLVLLLAFTLSHPAYALLPELNAQPGKFGIGLLDLSGTDDYRLGDEWGKRQVTPEVLASATPSFRRAALATARAGGATGFYLGKFAGRHVFATNHHVFESARQCLGNNIRLPLLGVVGRCETFLGTWPEIDLSLFTVGLTAADEAKVAPVAGNFDFAGELNPGQTLLTVGFGVAGNPLSQVMANQDSDCYVFSGRGESRLMADPDRWNTGPDRVWSFALGCDVSHGDSGSALVDRETSKVVGIIWTGRIPKAAVAQTSAGLKRMFEARGEAVWEELSYGVPAAKIGEILRAWSEGGNVPAETRAILAEMLR